MTDPLSAFSGAAAAVGLADVLLRSTKRLYIFFRELKDASKNTRLFLTELGDLDSLFAEVQSFSNDFANSALAVDDRLEIPEITKALDACHVALVELTAQVEALDIKDTDGKVKRMAKKLQFVCDQEKVSRPLRNIEKTRKNLVMALSVTAARGNVNLREQQKVTRHDISTFKDSCNVQIGNLDMTVKETSRETQQVLHSSFQDSATETQAVIRESIRTSNLVNNEKLSTLKQSIDNSAHFLQNIRESIGDSSTYMRDAHHSTQSLIVSSAKRTQNQATIGHKRISRQLDNMHTISRLSAHKQSRSAKMIASMNKQLEEVHTKLAFITVSTNPVSTGSTFEGFNLAAVTLPLMLVKPDLFTLLSSLISEQKLSVSQSDVDLFDSQLRMLLSECHEASAAAECSPGSVQLSKHGSHSKTTHHASSFQVPSHNSPKRTRRKFFRETSAGTLLLEVETGFSDHDKGSVVCGLYIAFIPKIGIVKKGVSIAFEKGMTFASQPIIERNIRIINILAPKAARLIGDIILKDNVQELRIQLQNRTFQPWDWPYGVISLIGGCMISGSPKCSKLLLQSGANFKETSLFEASTFSILWLGFFATSKHRQYSHQYYFDSYKNASDLAIANNVLFEEGDGLRHSYHPLQVIGHFCSKYDALSEVYHYLIDIGCKVGSRNDYRETALLISANQYGVNNTSWIEILLDNGADITAVDQGGRNALHLSILICFRHRHKLTRKLKYVIWEKLTLLLKSGCDPDVIDHNSFSPASYAVRNGLWVVWKAALLASGREDIIDRGSKKPKAAWDWTPPQELFCYYCRSNDNFCAEVDCELHSKDYWLYQTETSDSENEGQDSDECESGASAWETDRESESDIDEPFAEDHESA